MDTSKIRIWDVFPYIGDAVYEVTEINGNELTAGVVADILSDFGQFPAGITAEEREALIQRLGKEYVGG